MIPELGHFALVVALALAIAQSAFPFVGAASGRRALMGTSRSIATGRASAVQAGMFRAAPMSGSVPRMTASSRPRMSAK